MGGEKSDNIRFLVGFFVGGKLVDVMGFDIGFGNHYVGIVVALHDLIDDLLGRGFAQIIDIGLEGQSHKGYRWFAVILHFELKNRILDFLGTPHRFIVVDFAGIGDESGFLRICCCDEVGIYRYAVASDSGAGLEYIYARMFIGQFDKMPDIYT